MTEFITLEILMRAIVSTKKETSPVPESIEIGGTGATIASSAIRFLGGLRQEQLDTANGVAVLDENLLVKPENIPPLFTRNMPTVDIPSHDVTIGAQMVYPITNYGSNVNYTIQAIGGGEVQIHTFDAMIEMLENLDSLYNFNSSTPVGLSSVSGSQRPAGTILYHAANEAGPGGFILNGVQYNLNITTPHFDGPEILSPVMNEVISSRTYTVYTNSVYDNVNNSGAPVLLRYQVAEDNLFTLNLNTQEHGTSGGTYNEAAITGLMPNKLYYLRVQAQYEFYGSGQLLLIWSTWSNVVSFATSPIFNLTDVQVLRPPSAIYYDLPYYGQTLSMTSDASYLAIGDNNITNIEGTSVRGSVSIFKRATVSDIQNNIEAGMYYFENQLLASSIDSYGDKVLFDSTGRYCFISDLSSNVFHIYKSQTTPVSWVSPTLIGTITKPLTASGQFGHEISISDEISGYIYIAANDDYQKVFTYTLNTTDDTLTETDVLTYTTTDIVYQPYLFMSADGTRLIISSKNEYLQTDGQSQPIICGRVFIYKRTGGVWSFEQELHESNTSVVGYFGIYSAINANATEIIISAHDIYNYSRLYMYRKNVSQQWELVQTINVSDFSYEYGPFYAIYRIKISADGLTAYISMSDTLSPDRAVVYALRKVNDVWTVGQQLNLLYTQDYFHGDGDLVISNDGLTVAVGLDRDHYSLYSSGSVHIFE